MSKVLTVIAREYLERVRSKSFVIGTVLGPALMSMFIVLPALMADKGGDDRRTIAIVDQSGVVRGPLSDALVEDGRKSLTLEPVAVGSGGLEAAITEMKTMIVDDTVHSGVVVPADFVETGKVSFYNKSVSSLVVRDEMLKPALNREVNVIPRLNHPFIEPHPQPRLSQPLRQLSDTRFVFLVVA